MCYNSTMSGERGVNPLRARRRKIDNVKAALPAATGQEQVIGKILRRPAVFCRSRNIRTGKSLIVSSYIGWTEKAAGAGQAGKFNSQRREKMRMNFGKRSRSFFLCTMLIVAMALGATGCNGKDAAGSDVTTEVSTEASAQAMGEPQVLGEGSTVFPLSVVDAEGKETWFEIHTDKQTVGEALLELKLIDGDMGDLGLYIKTVNGLTVDYDKDGKYWAFYINGEYAQSGVDSTNITEGDSYSLKVE